MRKYIVTFFNEVNIVAASVKVECATVGMAVHIASDSLDSDNQGYKVLCDARFLSVEEITE